MIQEVLILLKTADQSYLIHLILKKSNNIIIQIQIKKDLLKINIQYTLKVKSNFINKNKIKKRALMAMNKIIIKHFKMRKG
jgi:hypothetical protein